MSENFQIRALQSSREIPYDLLALADPSEVHIKTYLEKGDCYIGSIGSVIVGVLVLLQVDRETVEIKNLAVETLRQGEGYGKRLLRYAERKARAGGYKTLRIGTGNSSLQQLDLYQRLGFEMKSIIQDFFLVHYDEPIIENGIQCKHMIVLEKSLLDNI